MRTDKITVFDLFERQRRYLVPVFQRGYVWTREDQWEPLWLDLKDQTEIVRNQASAFNPSVRKHFLGAVVLAQTPMAVRQTPAFEVIDGQQRLLTLQVLLSALRDVTAEGSNGHLQGTLQRLTRNPEPLRDPDELFKVWPTNAYRSDFRNVVQAGSRDALLVLYPQRMVRRRLVPPRPALISAYLYFYDSIDRYIRGLDDEESYPRTSLPPQNTELAEELTEAVTRYVQLVAIELDSEDDPQVIFETLNSRGVPLEPSDLIRNFLFLTAARRGEDADNLYQQWWRDFDATDQQGEVFWKQKERQGRMLRSRHDLFLFHYLTYRTAQEHKITHVFQDFKEWWEKGAPERVIASELATISNSSRDFKALIVPDTQCRLGMLASRLRALDTTTVYPLLLWLCEHWREVPADEFNGMLEDIESYLVRRDICGLTIKSYNRIFLNVLSKLKAERLPSRAILQRELLALEGDSAVWPDDNQFREDLIYRPVYHTLKPKKVRAVLEALEMAMRTPRQEDVSIPSSLTIEHVLPKGWEPEMWPLPAAEDPEEARRRRWPLVHSIGNLTLLTQPLNSAVSRGPFSIKRRSIAQQSLLRLNAYFQNLSDDDQWDERKILERGTHLAAKALAIWPRPASTSL